MSTVRPVSSTLLCVWRERNSNTAVLLDVGENPGSLNVNSLYVDPEMSVLMYVESSIVVSPMCSNSPVIDPSSFPHVPVVTSLSGRITADDAAAVGVPLTIVPA